MKTFVNNHSEINAIFCFGATISYLYSPVAYIPDLLTVLGLDHSSEGMCQLCQSHGRNYVWKVHVNGSKIDAGK